MDEKESHPATADVLPQGMALALSSPVPAEVHQTMSPNLIPLIVLAATTGLSYHVTVVGPDGELDTVCSDPCHVEQVRVVGSSGGGSSTTTETIEDDQDRSEERGVDCQGTCASGAATSVTFNFQTRRTLREGIELEISDGRAHFIFYDVVDVDGGQSTRRRHAEFNVDRALIEIELHGNDVRLEIVDPVEGP
jgi:hypothetical protein